MSNSRVLLFGILIALVLFCSTCLFTVAPYEHAVVECFGAKVDPIQLLGDPPGWIVTNAGTSGRPQGTVVPASVYEAELEEARRAGKALPYEATRAPLGSGLFLKWPAPFNRVHRFSNRLNIFKDSLKELQTRSSEPIMVQPYILWQIQDPLLFWKSVAGDEHRIDDRLESRLGSVMQALIGERYNVEDFYSLNQERLRELQESQRRRMLAVIVPPEVEQKINAAVADFKNRRSLRMTFERHEELSKAAPGGPALLTLPETAELAYFYRTFLLARRARVAAVADTAAAVKARSLRELENEALQRQLRVPIDTLRRDRNLSEAEIAGVTATARRLALEDLLSDEVQSLWNALGPVLQEMSQSGPAVLDNWAAVWKSPRIANYAGIYRDTVGRLATYLSEEAGLWGLTPADLSAAHTAALRRFEGYQLSRFRENLLSGAQRSKEQNAAADFAERVVRRFVETLSAEAGVPAPSRESVEGDVLFRLLLMSEGNFLEGRQRSEDARAKVGEGSAARADLPGVPELVTARQNRDLRILARSAAEVPAERSARIHAAARKAAEMMLAVEAEGRKEAIRLQDIRGYPRATVEEMKAQIANLERELTQASLSTRDTVKIQELENQVRDILNGELVPQYGIVVREVGIRRLSFPPVVSSAVYARMKAERDRIQRAILATGRMEAQAIITQAKSRREMTISEAEAEALRIRGEGQAQALSILAEVVDNLELFKLLQDLQSLEAILGKQNTTLVLQAGRDALLMRLFNRGLAREPGDKIQETIPRGVVRPEGAAPPMPKLDAKPKADLPQFPP
jgi:regulator of protease activity HflC (stomatin/prohibitin superfamily)